MAGTEKNCLLIVDDVEMNRAILSSIFEDEYKIIEAENGQEALKRLEQNDGQIAAVLLDVVMPVINGFEMLQYMKENNIGQDIPVFLITADASEKNMYEGYSLGVKDIIEKPFIPYFLKQRIRSVVDLYCTKEQLRETVEHQAEIIEEKVKEVNALSRNVIETLALAIEFRSGETGQHIQNIYQLTRILLRALREKGYPGCELSDEQIEQIATASMMHDIGKIAIPDSILNKPGRLTPEEYEEMKIHTLKGAEMIERMPNVEQNPVFSYAYDICRHHHERWDGSGYPDHLAGEENSIWAQIVALADVYDALVSRRCYKEPFEKEKAVQMISSGECGMFNPELVEVFFKIQENL
ncbi:MAG: response regulator [Lachnospiraceae bacterium]|nr:response regulator [Lachnospiraceae bacterium]